MITSFVALVLGQRVAIDDQGPGVGAGDGGGAVEQALDRVGDVVRLIEHVGGREAFAGRAARPRPVR